MDRKKIVIIGGSIAELNSLARELAKAGMATEKVYTESEVKEMVIKAYNQESDATQWEDVPITGEQYWEQITQ